MKSSEYQKARNGNLKDFMVEHLKDEIFVKKNLVPGSRISERKYSESLNISRAPIREALKELQEQGIITSISYKGWFVAEYDEADYREISRLRSILEDNLIECIITHGHYEDKDLSRLRSLNEELKQIASNHDLDKRPLKFIDKEMEFHNYLLGLSGKSCKWTNRILRNLNYQIYCTFDRWFYKDSQMNKSIIGHELILEALGEKDIGKLRETYEIEVDKEHVILSE